jgi:predicted RNA binding protein YcfA (HicA-like mRNA interferase family)
MSRRFSVCNAKEVIKVLSRHGFVLIGQTGSHQKWRHEDHHRRKWLERGGIPLKITAQEI